MPTSLPTRVVERILHDVGDFLDAAGCDLAVGGAWYNCDLTVTVAPLIGGRNAVIEFTAPHAARIIVSSRLRGNDLLMALSHEIVHFFQGKEIVKSIKDDSHWAEQQARNLSAAYVAARRTTNAGEVK